MIEEEAQPILPTNDSTNLRRKSWNSSDFSISIHSFSLIVQEELSSASNHYAADNQKLHKALYKLKREIIDILSKELTFYSLYPTKEMYKSMTEALIGSFLFLCDPIGDGTSCWTIFKVQDARSQKENKSG